MSDRIDHNFPAFHEAATQLRAAGYDVCNPAELEDGDTLQTWEHYMRRDIAQLVQCDAVATLSGWSESRGAKLEVNIARHLRMPSNSVRYWLEAAQRVG